MTLGVWQAKISRICPHCPRRALEERAESLGHQDERAEHELIRQRFVNVFPQGCDWCVSARQVPTGECDVSWPVRTHSSSNLNRQNPTIAVPFTVIPRQRIPQNSGLSETTYGRNVSTWACCNGTSLSNWVWLRRESATGRLGAAVPSRTSSPASSSSWSTRRGMFRPPTLCGWSWPGG